MPRIPTYEQQTRSSSAGLGPGPNEQPSGGGRTLSAFGGMLDSVANDRMTLRQFEKQKAEERAAVWANEQMTSARSRWVEELPQRQAAATEDAAGFTPQLLKDFDEDANERIKVAPTEASRNWLKDRLGQTRLALQQDALGFEAKRGVEYKVNGLSRAIDGARTSAEFRPESFPTLAAEQHAAIEASGLPADVQRELRQKAVDSLASASVEGMIRRDPYKALTLLNESPIAAQDGSPALRNADGSVSTMLTATVTTDELNGGRPTNIPTVWSGKQLTEREAIDKALESGRTFPAFGSIDEAVNAAKNASREKGERIGPDRLAVNALPFERRQMLRNSAEAEINRRESEAKGRLTEVRQALNDQMVDIRAAASNGMTITDVPSKASLVAAFGEQEGAQRYNQTLAFATLSPKISALYQAPLDQVVKTVEGYKPTQVQGAADQYALMGIVQQKASAILKEREADAAGYLTRHSALVNETWTAFQQAKPQESDAAATDYLRAVRAEKERLGIQSQDVLPGAYADAVVDQLTKPQAAETLAARMASEAQRWGSTWPEVYRQVQKKLPDAALVIGSGIPKRAADTLALMSSKTEDELKVLIPAGHSKADIEKDATDDLSTMLSTFGPEASKVMGALHSSTVKTAIGYMASGSSYKEAITQAAKDIANNRYTFQDFRDQAYRVPVEIDADLVDEGATFFLERYAQPSGTVQVPAGTPEEVILSQATDSIRRTGYWRTAPDESGLRLYVNNAVVPGVGGKPVQLTWEQLQQQANAAAAADWQRQQKEAERRMRNR